MRVSNTDRTIIIVHNLVSSCGQCGMMWVVAERTRVFLTGSEVPPAPAARTVHLRAAFASFGHGLASRTRLAERLHFSYGSQSVRVALVFTVSIEANDFAAVPAGPLLARATLPLTTYESSATICRAWKLHRGLNMSRDPLHVRATVLFCI
jgi:hypothetical protein